jgi:hypothetical protein
LPSRKSASALPESAQASKSSDATHPGDREAARAASSADAAGEAARRAAHRLPTGAYPVITESASMRPDNESHPEPADLFRPGSKGENMSASESSGQSGSEATTQVGAVQRPLPQDAAVIAPSPSPSLLGRPEGPKS